MKDMKIQLQRPLISFVDPGSEGKSKASLFFLFRNL